jgi:Tfp pilus assembly protein PilE
MNLQRHAAGRERGFTLIEVMVYVSMVFLVLGIAYQAMYKSMDASAGLRRNANDIVRAMRTGERWREDVRNATGPIRLEKTNDGETVLRVPQNYSEIAYRFTTNCVTRRSGKGEWLPVLDNVKNSDFIADQRNTVTGWRWEVELQTYRKALSRTRPLFTFIAVPANSAK